MKYTYKENGDERYAGRSFDATWGKWHEGKWQESKGGDTLLVWGTEGWYPLFNHTEFGVIENAS